MLFSLLSSVLVLGTGALVLRLLGLSPGLAGVGLAASVGFAAAASLQTWLTFLGLPLGARSATSLALGLAGATLLAAAAWRAWRDPPTRVRRTCCILLAASLLVPQLMLAVAFNAIQVPVWNLDGAFHVEVVAAAMAGWAGLRGWYPPGYQALYASLVGLNPWTDVALSTFQASWSLAGLACLAGAGLAAAIWRQPLQACLAGATLALAYYFPYQPHTWSNWPLAASVMLAIGLWTVASAHLDRPRLALAALAGLLVGAIVLVHGTELYTGALGLLLLAICRWRQVRPITLVHALAGLLVALVVAAPYLADLLTWLQGGGAVGTALTEIEQEATAPALGSGNELELWYASGVLGGNPLDLAVRMALLAVGTVWVWRDRRGRWLVAVTAVFVLLTVASTNVHGAGMDWLVSHTYPWSLKSRLVYVPVIGMNLLEACGLYTVLAGLLRARGGRLLGLDMRRPALWRRTATAAAILLFAVGWGSVISTGKYLTEWGADAQTFTPADQAAMAWLRQHASAGETVVTDGAGDAGVWLPFKAGVAIVRPRSASGADASQGDRLIAHVAELATHPDLARVACALRARYVYVGARHAYYVDRLLPSMDVLVRAAALAPAFEAGGAAVFRLTVPCDP